MKKLLIALAITALSFTVNAETPIDGKSSQVKNKEQAQAAAKLVRAFGYQCDSISSFQPKVFGSGFVINCNRFSYTYIIKDVGGRITVTVD